MKVRPPWTRSLRSRSARRLGLGFFVGLAVASCDDYGREDFNLEATSLICEVRSKCGEDLTDPAVLDLDFGAPMPEPSCAAEVLQQFDVCAGECEFHEARARRCINRLESMADDCDVTSLGPCRRVYDQCEGAESCNLWRCSVGTEGGPAGGMMALGLLLLGWSRRRRGPTAAGTG
ncbi:MAG: MYXO-CTERM sorting domain-containing protein [Nannocystaceae bacterium]